MIRRADIETTDLDDIALGPASPPVTPGEVLLEEFMRPLELSPRALAAELNVPISRIYAIISGSRPITGKIAILLGRQFGMPAEFWMGLQTAYDLAVARKKMASSQPKASKRSRNKAETRVWRMTHLPNHLANPLIIAD